MTRITFTDLLPERHEIVMSEDVTLVFRDREELDVEELANFQTLMNQAEDIETKKIKAKGSPRTKKQDRQARVLKSVEEMKGILGDILQIMAVDPIPEDVLAGISVGMRGKMVRWLSEQQAPLSGNASSQPSPS